MSAFNDIVVDVRDGIGTIKFNRPKQLNSFGGKLVSETVSALRDLDAHPDTIFTVITGEGRFFSAGADVSNISALKAPNFSHAGESKIFWAERVTAGTELVRSLIEHRKVLVLAMNGPAVGAGGAWFQGACDLFFAAQNAWLQITFSQLGLVPEMGSALNWTQSLGVHRANEILMFGERVGVEELRRAGLVNRVFEEEGFHAAVHGYLKSVLEGNDGNSMLEMKRLQNARLRDQRILSLFESSQALAERFVEGEPTRRMSAKMNELAEKRRAKGAKL